MLNSFVFVQDGVGKPKGEIMLAQVIAIDLVDPEALGRELAFQVIIDLITVFKLKV